MSKTRVHGNEAICGAKTRSGTPCQMRAGWGTNHVGEGRCKLHGGMSTGPRDRKKISEWQQGNKNAEKHGLFSKYLPEETKDLVDSIEGMNRLDLLWENIKIQAAAIMRSQKLMYVEDKEDIDKNITETINGDVEIDKYQIATAEQKQANYLNSQSRAMGMLTRMIKEYEELSGAALKAEIDQATLEQIKARTNQITGVAENIEDLSGLKKLVELDEQD